jgi:hypothetical protein
MPRPSSTSFSKASSRDCGAHVRHDVLRRQQLDEQELLAVLQRLGEEILPKGTRMLEIDHSTDGRCDYFHETVTNVVPMPVGV